MSCPFCEVKIPRPELLPELVDVQGGRCQCGALYVADEAGKAGGQALLDGLTLLADGDIDRAMALTAGSDYELKDVGWRPRNHSKIPHKPGRGRSFGQAKIWFFRHLEPAHESS